MELNETTSYYHTVVAFYRIVEKVHLACEQKIKAYGIANVYIER